MLSFLGVWREVGTLAIVGGGFDEALLLRSVGPSLLLVSAGLVTVLLTVVLLLRRRAPVLLWHVGRIISGVLVVHIVVGMASIGVLMVLGDFGELFDAVDAGAGVHCGLDEAHFDGCGSRRLGLDVDKTVES